MSICLMTYPEMRAVLAAAEAGELLERTIVGSDEWSLLTGRTNGVAYLDFSRFVYRVAEVDLPRSCQAVIDYFSAKKEEMVANQEFEAACRCREAVDKFTAVLRRMKQSSSPS